MTLETTLGILAVSIGIVTVAFNLRKEAIDFQRDFLDRVLATKKMIEARSVNKSVGIIMALAELSDNESSIAKDELQKRIKSNMTQFRFAEQINAISQTISEAKDLMDDYHTAWESKIKFATLLMATGLVVGANIPFLEFLPQSFWAIIVLGDFLLIVLVIPMYSHYRDYTKSERELLAKIEQENTAENVTATP